MPALCEQKFQLRRFGARLLAFIALLPWILVVWALWTFTSPSTGLNRSRLRSNYGCFKPLEVKLYPGKAMTVPISEAEYIDKFDVKDGEGWFMEASSGYLGNFEYVVEPFCFEDAKTGLVWHAPRGAATDGASVPEYLSIFTGIKPIKAPHLAAAIMHDHWCHDKNQLRSTVDCWQVHKSYFNMLMALGVNRFKAFLMYLAVLVGGPRW